MSESPRIHPVADMEAQRPRTPPPPPPQQPAPKSPVGGATSNKLPERQEQPLLGRQGQPPLVSSARPPPPPPLIPFPPPKRSSNCCCRCIWWTFCVMFSLIVAIVIAGVVVYMAFKPKAPTYSVDRLQITDLRLNLDLSLYARFLVKITATNWNDKIGIYYEKGGEISVWYTNTELCKGAIPEFYQGHHNKTVLDVALTGQNQYGNALMSAIRQQQTGNVPLDLKVNAPVAVKLGGLKLMKVKVKVKCDLVVDSLSASSSFISIKTSNCTVGLKL